MKNTLKTTLLLGVLTGLLLAAGRALGGENGLTLAFGLSLLMNIGAYWWSDKIVLKMYGARPLTPQDAPGLFGMVRRLAERLQIPMPAVYRIPDSAPNAFATGRSPAHAAVAVTDGLVEMLNERELEGVIAHELGHVINRDTLVSTVAASLAGALSMLADMALWRSVLGGREDREGGHPAAALASLIVAPLAAGLLQAALSRTREFGADQTGAETCGDPLALASALEKIERWKDRGALAASPAPTASLFIINPLSGRQMLQLFSTHPPTRERVARLRKMALQPRRVA